MRTLSVLIPFKRERLSELKGIFVSWKSTVKRFNSLQTGKAF